MPSTTMPRLIEPMSVSAFRVPTGFLTSSHSGIIKTRSAVTAGRIWTEEYGPMNMMKPDTNEMFSWIRWAWQNNIIFEVDHPSAPGIGMSIRGSGTGTPTVDGASQTGDTLDTTGWTVSTTGLMLPGDFFKIDGIDRVFEVLESVDSDASGDAEVVISPSIYSGGSPDDAADISLSGNLIRATFIEEPNLPTTESSFWWSGLKLTYVEVP